MSRAGIRLNGDSAKRKGIALLQIAEHLKLCGWNIVLFFHIRSMAFKLFYTKPAFSECICEMLYINVTVFFT